MTSLVDVATLAKELKMEQAYAFLTGLNPEYDQIRIQRWKEEAIADPKWKNAMVEKMQALKKNDTWELVPSPNGKKPVECKWVFTIKQNVDGIIARYKARLVAKGFTQIYGINY
ncbi:uncharacterized mitochondrial protein AtMg00820-like [Telopea speciosissima]|uniref:uncharacterized mitochondrial protein AtMg00820-like n=1 Tax=Telopea speciosissima TaxID=54955 RepID=UPI001CC594B7|nr:uncharacterized mitochondrial protein AtMg00820-like [Telopea speciosissima]